MARRGSKRTLRIRLLCGHWSRSLSGAKVEHAYRTAGSFDCPKCHTDQGVTDEMRVRKRTVARSDYRAELEAQADSDARRGVGRTRIRLDGLAVTPLPGDSWWWWCAHCDGRRRPARELLGMARSPEALATQWAEHEAMPRHTRMVAATRARRRVPRPTPRG